jgi:hypothetical protein
MKLACLTEHRQKYEAKIVINVWVLKLKCVNSAISGSQEFLWLIYDSSNNVMYCDVCRQSGSDIIGKTEFVTGKEKLNVKVLFIK